jgi:hypothetical protein
VILDKLSQPKSVECYKEIQAIFEVIYRGGIKIFKVLARLASNSKFLLAKSEKNSPKSCLCWAFVQCALAGKKDSMRGGKKHSPSWRLSLKNYSPISNFTRIWWVGEWLFPPLYLVLALSKNIDERLVSLFVLKLAFLCWKNNFHGNDALCFHHLRQQCVSSVNRWAPSVNIPVLTSWSCWCSSRLAFCQQ